MPRVRFPMDASAAVALLLRVLLRENSYGVANRETAERVRAGVGVSVDATGAGERDEDTACLEGDEYPCPLCCCCCCVGCSVLGCGKVARVGAVLESNLPRAATATALFVLPL